MKDIKSTRSRADLGLEFLEFRKAKLKPNKKADIKPNPKKTKRKHEVKKCKDSKIVNIKLKEFNEISQPHSNERTEQPKVVKLEDRSRSMEDIENIKKIKQKAIKNSKIGIKFKREVSHKEIKEYMEHQNKKRKFKEKLEYLKAQREKIKLKAQLEELESFTSKNRVKSKLKDRTYNGIISPNTLNKIKDKSENPYQYNSKTSKERDSKYNSSTNEVEQEARTFKYAKYLTYFKDRKLSIKFKYKSQPNKFKRKDKSLEDLGESLQKQVDKLKISQNGNVKLKTKEKTARGKNTTRNHSHRSKKPKYTSQSPSSGLALAKDKVSKPIKSKSVANLHCRKPRNKKSKNKSESITEAAKIIQKHWRKRTLKKNKENSQKQITPEQNIEAIPLQRNSDQGSCQSRRKLKHSFSFGMDFQIPPTHSSNVMFGCVKQPSQDMNSARFVEPIKDSKPQESQTEIKSFNDEYMYLIRAEDFHRKKEEKLDKEFEVYKEDIRNEDRFIDAQFVSFLKKDSKNSKVECINGFDTFSKDKLEIKQSNFPEINTEENKIIKDANESDLLLKQRESHEFYPSQISKIYYNNFPNTFAISFHNSMHQK